MSSKPRQILVVDDNFKTTCSWFFFILDSINDRRSLLANFSRQGRSLWGTAPRWGAFSKLRFGLNSTWEKRLRIRLLRGNDSVPFVPVAIDAPRVQNYPRDEFSPPFINPLSPQNATWTPFVHRRERERTSLLRFRRRGREGRQGISVAHYFAISGFLLSGRSNRSSPLVAKICEFEASFKSVSNSLGANDWF